MPATEPIRIFVGTEEKTEIARKVLECSIRRRTQVPVVEVVPMIGPAWEYPTAGIKVGTGFSLRRWMIPAACGWQGRAIYLDADQMVLGDIQDLWNKPDTVPDPGASVWCTYQPDKYSKQPWPQTSVMVIDCARASAEWGWRIDEVLAHLKGDATREKYADFMHCVSGEGKAKTWWTKAAPARVGVEWNSLNVYAPKKTKLLHYTKEPDQPWYKPNHPHAGLWKDEFKLALEWGYVTPDEVRAAVGKFGTKEDWRNTNGLHPDYLKYL